MIRPGYDVFYTQINLPNIIKCKNKCFFFFLYSNSGFEYRIKKIRSGYITF